MWWVTRLLVALVAVLVAAWCGGGEEGGGDEAPRPLVDLRGTPAEDAGASLTDGQLIRDRGR